MSLLRDLNSQRKLFAECPNCGEEFRLIDADLFDATRTALPLRAAEYLNDMQTQLAARRAELRLRKYRAVEHPRRVAESVNIGKVVEKIAPSLPGFPVKSSDCRPLFEPIDYVVFHGLSAKGQIDSLSFVDVKSGQARLSPGQLQVRSLVECGKVSLIVAERPEES